jgi:hypothetical protein
MSVTGLQGLYSAAMPGQCRPDQPNLVHHTKQPLNGCDLFPLDNEVVEELRYGQPQLQ